MAARSRQRPPWRDEASRWRYARRRTDSRCSQHEGVWQRRDCRTTSAVRTGDADLAGLIRARCDRARRQPRNRGRLRLPARLWSRLDPRPTPRPSGANARRRRALTSMRRPCVLAARHMRSQRPKTPLPRDGICSGATLCGRFLSDARFAGVPAQRLGCSRYGHTKDLVSAAASARRNDFRLPVPLPAQ